MKKLLAYIIIASTLLITLSACGNSNGSADGDQAKLVIGVDDKFAPMGFRDENNELTGFDIEYAKAAGEAMGMEVTFQPIDWKTKETELSSGRIDLIWNGYTITNDRKEKVLFTKPYLENEQVIVTKADSSIDRLEDLSDKDVALQALSSAADALNGSPVRQTVKSITEYADNVLALTDLKAGRVDAVVIDEVVIDYYMAKEEGQFKVLDESLSSELYGIGVKKGNEALLDKLQNALNQLNDDGTAEKISQKWFGESKVLK
ncbi:MULTISPECIES: amino acid ABC transporter substrate-binding protein [Sporosarcina]|uniref:Amino acid ABC transporter substrate-binding protein n=1 Tax=Sporosarcina contaminans TaxID=633403 RepID=A0ABW3U2M6_9BACL